MTATLTACMAPKPPSSEDPSRYQGKRRIPTPNPDGSQAKWSDRYLAYRLISQYTNLNYPVEQRERDRLQSQQLQDRFKWDLARYAAHAHLPPKDRQVYANPTLFGDDVLRLIKLVLVGRGRLNYRRLTHLFLHQTEAITYQKFKENLLTYLGFSEPTRTWTDLLRDKLSHQLRTLYTARNSAIVDDALSFRTCNRAIELLTTEDGQRPSAIFNATISCGMPLFMTLALLKLTLISPKSRTHLERCISQLICYYEQFPAHECQSMIQFFEIFQIVFAVYADDVEYSLVKIQPSTSEAQEDDGVLDLDDYRVFARLITG